MNKTAIIYASKHHGSTYKLVKTISDRFEHLLHSKEPMVSQLDFYGHDFGMERLGFLLII